MLLGWCQFIQCEIHKDILILIYHSVLHWPSQSVEADKLAATSMMNMQENLCCVAKETLLWLYTVHDQRIRRHNHQLTVCNGLLSLLWHHHLNVPRAGDPCARIVIFQDPCKRFWHFPALLSLLKSVSSCCLRIPTGRSFMSSLCFHTRPAAFTWGTFEFTPSVTP